MTAGAISLLGLILLIAGLYATSTNRKAINWHTVISGFLIQYIIALFVLRTGVGYDIFEFISRLARELLGFAKDGVAFLTSTEVSQLGMFFFTVLPAIIFFVALVQMLYYWGLVQWFVGKFAVFFFWAMRISGAEAVVAAATPFIGQGESAMLIKPFVPHLTRAEIHQVMCSGFATIAGSVLVAYIGLGVNPQILISSCVMSIPASLACSKLRYPEVEESLSAGKIVIPDDEEHRASNTIHAFANGAWLGLKIAGMILTTLLCIIAIVALFDGILTWLGRYIGLRGEYDLTLTLILGYVFYPVAFLLGVPRGPDLLKVSRLIATKIITVRSPPEYLLQKTALITSPTERIQRIHPSDQRHQRVLRHVPSRQHHRVLQSMRLRQHWFFGNSARCLEPACPKPFRRRREHGSQRFDHRCFCYFEQCQHCGHGHSRRGWLPSPGIGFQA